MPTNLGAIKARLRRLLKPSEDAKILRRRALMAFIWRWQPVLRVSLFAAGYLWMMCLPSPRLGRYTFIDENALQPGQVNTYWNWAEVHRCDLYLAQLEVLRNSNASSTERAEFLRIEFEKLGLPASTQSYSYSIAHETVSGTNVFSVFSAPRASGAEAMVISASWLSLSGDGEYARNMRGVATVLGLASFLKRYSLWAKDIVFVISDGHMDGMHAWLSTYHGAIQSNLEAEPLVLASGVIWTALNIDYPGHSFSHLGVFFEGLDGRLPNQDLINSFQVISRHTGGVPVLLYDQYDPKEYGDRVDNLSVIPKWLPSFIRENSEINEYATRAKNIARHVGYQALGQASGVHGVFHRYRIDAITLFAVPAEGPHGFHAIGRIVESTLRTMNNLLERLHASFFFYILTTPGTFLQIGHYLPSAILISTSLMFGGLSEWVNAGWIQVSKHELVDSKNNLKTLDATALVWEMRDRPVLNALLIMLTTHAMGLLLFTAITNGWSPNDLYVKLAREGALPSNVFMRYTFSFILLYMIFQGSRRTLIRLGIFSTSNRTLTAPLSMVLKSTNLYLTSTMISVTSVLNFSLAAMSAVLLGIPLSLSSAQGSALAKEVKFHAYVVGAFASLMFFVIDAKDTVWSWEIFGVWFAPFMCLVYVPILMQAAFVCVLPS